MLLAHTISYSSHLPQRYSSPMTGPTPSPIMAIFEFDTEEEVVKQANDTSMGLASCKSTSLDYNNKHELTSLADFFTKNVDRTWRLLENLEAGMIGMNTGNSSAAETPFGGIKESGYGKESGKDVAVSEYCVRFCPSPLKHLIVANIRTDHEDGYPDSHRSVLDCIC